VEEMCKDRLALRGRLKHKLLPCLRKFPTEINKISSVADAEGHVWESLEEVQMAFVNFFYRVIFIL
jgi:hypothetical protein